METGSWVVDGGDLMLSSIVGEMRFAAGAAGLEDTGRRYGQAGLKLHRLE